MNEYQRKKAGLVKLTDIISFGENEIEKQYKQISINMLQPFSSHPFKLYSGERMENMIQSIRMRGVLQPLIVRKKNGSEIYEILSGHNRWYAARECGLDEVPTVIYSGLTDRQAMIIVTETNLAQRAFSELAISEKASILGIHYGILKNDKESIELVNSINSELSNLTVFPLGTQTNSCRKLGDKYELKKSSVARFLRIDTLDDYFKNLLDEEQLSIRAAVQLSYLKASELEMLEMILKEKHYNISMKIAECLRKYSNEQLLSEMTIVELLTGDGLSSSTKGFKIKGEIIGKYFSSEQSANEIEEIISKALEQYFISM